MQRVTGIIVQRDVHFCGSPLKSARKHALLAWHVSAFVQLASGSQVSPGSMTPLPQTAGQSSSRFRFAPSGQHASPFAASRGMASQWLWHMLPTS